MALAAFPAVPTSVQAQLPAPPVVGTGLLQLGGYAGLTLSRPEHPESVEKAEVSELVAALMAWGQLSPRASYLVELDMAKRTTETWTGREEDRRLVPVRLYLEYTLSDLLRVRAGRFLTPMGQWNEHHAEPLTWTPTRPLNTYRPFAKSLTGLLVAGEGSVGGHDAGYALFWAPSARLDRPFEESEESSFAHALGARLAVEARPGLAFGVGASLQRRARPAESNVPGMVLPDEPGEREEEDEGRALLAADMQWASARLEISAEATYIPSAESAAAEGGAFAQGAVRLGGPLWLVARAEAFSPVDGRTVRVGYTGLTVRTGPRLVVKVGRQFSRHPSNAIPDGWFLSFSSLF
jgi:hypothetical protein